VEMSDGAGWTRFASGARAFARLPAEDQAWLDRQQVTTQYSMNGGSVPFRREAVVRWPGRPAPVLYLSRFAAPRIEGLSKDENNARLAAIWEHLYAPEEVYHHDWRVGDLIVWDNLSLQHARPEISIARPRRLQRVVVARKSMLDQVPAELAGVTYEGEEAARNAY
jgi:taurine dioxygenase